MSGTAPYDLADGELKAACFEAAEFAKTIAPWPIQEGHGTYRQKRPGLGISVLGYDVADGVWSIRYSVHAWNP